MCIRDRYKGGAENAADASWEAQRIRGRLAKELGYKAVIMDDAFFKEKAAAVARALDDMHKLEAGGIANPDEKRMVGHYWLRAPALAPTLADRRVIEDTLLLVTRFAADVHLGRIRSELGERFDNVLVVGIGGSALGPQFVADALGSAHDRMRSFFFDNTCLLYTSRCV